MDVPTESVTKAAKDFAKGSIRLVKRCTKPDRKGRWRLGVADLSRAVGLHSGQAAGPTRMGH